MPVGVVVSDMDRYEIDGYIYWVPKGAVFDAHTEAKRLAEIKEVCEKFDKEFNDDREKEA